MKIFLILMLFIFSSCVFSQGWCNYLAGDFQVITNGTKSESVYLLGKLEGENTNKWVRIANSTIGKYNLSLILAAQMSGKGLGLYIDSLDYDCSTYPSWSISPIRHVKINM